MINGQFRSRPLHESEPTALAARFSTSRDRQRRPTLARSAHIVLQNRSVCVCLALLSLPAVAHAQWIEAPTENQLKNTPGLTHHTLDSAIMKTGVGYSVVLPPGYHNGSRERYPVVYWLHGGGGNESSSLFTAQSWRDVEKTETIRPVILVYPNGFRSGYMDHHDGKTMIESLIIKELIPLIDANYRTIASREGRAVHGFSMGSSGALKFAIKYPELFCSAVAYGGGSIDLAKSKSQFILDILQRNLKSDTDLIRQNNTYHFLEQNHEIVRANGTRFLLICGDADSWKESAATFQQALRAKSLPCDLTLVPGVGHNLPSLIKAEGAAAVRFQDQVFQKAARRTIK